MQRQIVSIFQALRMPARPLPRNLNVSPSPSVHQEIRTINNQRSRKRRELRTYLHSQSAPTERLVCSRDRKMFADKTYHHPPLDLLLLWKDIVLASRVGNFDTSCGVCGSTQCPVEASDAYYEFCRLQAGSPFAGELWQGSHLSIAGGVSVERWNARESRNREVPRLSWLCGKRVIWCVAIRSSHSPVTWPENRGLNDSKVKVDVSKVLRFNIWTIFFREWFCCPRWSLPESLRRHLWHSWQHWTSLVGGDVGCRAVALGLDKHGGFHSFRAPSEWTIKSDISLFFWYINYGLLQISKLYSLQ